jgi:hypothetical protein
MQHRGYLGQSVKSGPADYEDSVCYILPGDIPRKFVQSVSRNRQCTCVYAINKCYHSSDIPFLSHDPSLHHLTRTSCLPSPLSINSFFPPAAPNSFCLLITLCLSYYLGLPSPPYHSSLAQSNPKKRISMAQPFGPSKAAGDWARNVSEVAICLPS